MAHKLPSLHLLRIFDAALQDGEGVARIILDENIVSKAQMFEPKFCVLAIGP